MSRFIFQPRTTSTALLIDPTLPVSCQIENSYILNGHGEYCIRVTRIYDDPSGSWIIKKRFREFNELNDKLKDYGFNFELPRKKLLGNTDRAFMTERQKGLQTYLNALVQHVELCNSLVVHRFLDPNNHVINYPESALQHVSMFVRSMNNIYHIIESLPDFGWRYDKSYFLAAKAGCPKDEHYLLIWCHYGLNKSFNEKDTFNCLKLIKSISHPLIEPIEDVYANESGALIVYRFYSKGSLKDYMHQTKPSRGFYWQRYGPRSVRKRCDLNQIKIIGRQILEALYFIYENNLVYGHLHSGNILFDTKNEEKIKLLDFTNAIVGVSSKNRAFVFNMKHCRTPEQYDVYSFGRLLYELSTGEEFPTSISSEHQCTVPIPVQDILSKIFHSSSDFPTVSQLLNEPIFQIPFLNNSERLQLKLNAKAQHAFEHMKQVFQERLENEQAKIKHGQRNYMISNYLMSDEEKLRRRRERQMKALRKKMENSSNSLEMSRNDTQSVPIDQLEMFKTSEVTKKDSLMNNSSDTISVTHTISSSSSLSSNNNRSQLLNSITDFDLSKLKKSQTNDRSTPKFN